MWDWTYSSTILYSETTWRWAVIFTLLPLYPHGKSPQYPSDGQEAGWSSEPDWTRRRRETSCRESNHGLPSPKPVTISTDLSRFSANQNVYRTMWRCLWTAGWPELGSSQTYLLCSELSLHKTNAENVHRQKGVKFLPPQIQLFLKPMPYVKYKVKGSDFFSQPSETYLRLQHGKMILEWA